jgi:glucosamine--fructose-6-phosphate aminotransferase (isomerizing)
MCGIVGYLGKHQALPILIDGLKRLEYRGYDSAGIAIIDDGHILLEKTEGKISELEAHLAGRECPGFTGIAHTRWATHGEPNKKNAHPHIDCSGTLAVAHNGIIENYQILKKRLQDKGHRFITDTDTEVIAHLIEDHYTASLEDAVRKAAKQLEGTYGIVVISKREPDKLIGVRNGSPLVVGVADDEYFLASDVSAILKHTRQVIYLDDREMAIIEPGGFKTMTIENVTVDKAIHEVDWDLEMIEKGGFPHFMLKEIFEQPETIRNAMRGRLVHETGEAKLGGLQELMPKLREFNRLVLLGCGTSWHAALIGEYIIEEYARVPVEVEYASEFRYRNPIVDGGTVTVAISQSEIGRAHV